MNKITRKSKPPPNNLTKNENGEPIQSPEAVASTWERFLRGKFQATEAEADRPPLDPLPTARTEEDNLTLDEFESAISKLKNSKATGPDDIPIEVYKQKVSKAQRRVISIHQICVGQGGDP